MKRAWDGWLVRGDRVPLQRGRADRLRSDRARPLLGSGLCMRIVGSKIAGRRTSSRVWMLLRQ